ncbi:hypothetical protein [Pseudomonas aeruginosa]|uniref:hypothetical protein n=1 Tax=Pseudomonas aeruginosa TaxID=287 RepID=UPI003BF49A24
MVSTSANLSGLEPCRTTDEVNAQFNGRIPVVDGLVGGRKNPSEIRDALTGQLYRQGCQNTKRTRNEKICRFWPSDCTQSVTFYSPGICRAVWY